VAFITGIVSHCTTGPLFVSARIFVDSSILIYAYDTADPRKHGIALQALKDLWASKSGVLSMQVLQEFYAISTRKIANPIPRSEARDAVEEFAQWCIETTPKEVLSAFRIEDNARISLWDALIVAAALKGGATQILSEDMNHGQTIAGIRIVNPFAV
jgi:predicted nucleic acid-binding protein